MSRSSQDGHAAALVAQRLERVDAMDKRALRAEWQTLFRHDPPLRMSRKLLLLGVAWKTQAQALGGLSAAVKKQLNALAKSINDTGDIRRDRVARLKPGAKLVREWQGETHTVIVLENGFEWRGSQWRSLTAIARAISGGHWSGPRFFGLTPSRRGVGSP